MSDRLRLDGVTLCSVDCVNASLALQAMQRSRAACDVARSLLLTSQDVAAPEGIDVIRIPPIRSKREYSQFLVKRLPSYVQTPHLLVVQWDGYIVRPDQWDPKFLEYDYVGAPWPPDLSPVAVGNGGFSLRSRKLIDALLDPSFPEEAIVHEDQAICVHFRQRLEADFGIRFAPADVAARFSHETQHDGRPTFGFHGPQNLWMYWSEQDIENFVRNVSRPVLRQPEVTWLVRHLYSADRLKEGARVAAAALVEQPDNAELLDLVANMRDRLKPHDYKARSEQRFFLGMLKRHLPDFFRGKRAMEIGRPGAAAVTQEWFEHCRVLAPAAALGAGGREAETLEAYSAASESFDVIVSCETFEHLPHWREVFANALRMLRPDGLMVVTCAGLGRRQHETRRYPTATAKTDEYYRNLSADDFAGMDPGRHFRFWRLLEDRTVHDLYFVGLGTEASDAHATTLRKLMADTEFLQTRKNLLGIY